MAVSTAQRGAICWAIFAVVLVILIILTATTSKPAPKDFYQLPEVEDTFDSAERLLYQGLGPVYMKPTYTLSKVKALAQFQLGLQLLHMFSYDLAREKFTMAQKIDPSFAMAYWGEALTYKQPLWQTEQLQSGQNALATMDKFANLTGLKDWEMRYIDAVRGLFDPNKDLQGQETGYKDAMMSLVAEFQNDPDACALSALAMQGMVHSRQQYLSDDEALMLRQEAADHLVMDCLKTWPQHAGALNYITHVYDVDTPGEAEKGIPYAMSLAQVASASSRAQHMLSHLALRTGNWTQFVMSNQAAITASDAYCKAAKKGLDCDADNKYHALEWLEYGSLQVCNFTRAATQLKAMQTTALAMGLAPAYSQWLYRMYANAVLQSQNFIANATLFGEVKGVAGKPANATLAEGNNVPLPLYPTSETDLEDISDHFWPPHAEAHALLARAYQLTWNKTAASVQSAATKDTLAKISARMDALVATRADTNAAASPDMYALLTVVRGQLQGYMAFVDCTVNGVDDACTNWRAPLEAALATYRNISSSTVIPSLKISPTQEFYANLLVKVNATATDGTTPADLYNECLTALPGRMTCILGMARAHAAQANMAGAREWYGKFSAQCAAAPAADRMFAGFAEARAINAMPPPPGKRPSGRGLRRAMA